MALVGHISGSSQSNSTIGISGSVIIANRPNSLFPSFPGSDTTFFVSGALDGTAVSVFGGDVVVSGAAKINSTLYTQNLEVNNEVIVGALTVENLVAGQILYSGMGGGVSGSMNLGYAEDVLGIFASPTTNVFSVLGDIIGTNAWVGQNLVIGQYGTLPGGYTLAIDTVGNLTSSATILAQDLDIANEAVVGSLTVEDMSQYQILYAGVGGGVSGSNNLVFHEDVPGIVGSGATAYLGITGDVVGANSAEFSGDLFIGGAGPYATFTVNGSTGDVNVAGSVVIAKDLTVNGAMTTVNTTNLEVKDSLIGLGFTSGSIAQTNGDRGFICGLSSSNDVAMFWDNSASEFAVAQTDSTPGSTSINIISYAQLHVDVLTGSLVKASSLTGSLTKLNDGTDYLRAGSNIPLTTGSGGEITIGVTNLTNTSEYFYSTTNDSIYTTGSTAFRGSESIDSPLDKGSDVFFYVSGSSSKIALFGGTIATSGSLKVDGNTTLGDASTDTITFNGRANSSILPSVDVTYNLGGPSNRWANIYTGDLHLRNDRGDWTVIEEDEYLSIRNNKTGKMYKFVLEEVK